MIYFIYFHIYKELFILYKKKTFHIRLRRVVRLVLDCKLVFRAVDLPVLGRIFCVASLVLRAFLIAWCPLDGLLLPDSWRIFSIKSSVIWRARWFQVFNGAFSLESLRNSIVFFSFKSSRFSIRKKGKMRKLFTCD